MRKHRPDSSISRRGLLKRSAVAVAALGAARWTARSYAQIAGANEALRVAVVGCGPMGQSHINDLLRPIGVRLVGLCDPDQAILDRAMTIANARAGNVSAPITQYRDVRKVIENRDIDAITIAAPNHWHSLMTIWACQAGKDVYVEKPVCHDLWEGAQAIAASRKYNRIVQAGTQWRSRPQVFEAFEWIKAGNLGKTLVSRGVVYKRRESIGKTSGPQPVPPTCDYDLWCGPSPNDGLHRAKLHYDWHWFWKTGNGEIGNVGCHHIDLARWALGKSTVAPSVITVGGRMGYVDDGQTPNTMFAVHDYGDSQLIFEARGLPTRAGAGNRMDQYKGVEIGNIVECEGGYVTVDMRRNIAWDHAGKQIREFTGADVTRDRNHIANFVKAVRSRRREDQNAELTEGHTSAALSHLGNISHRLGQPSNPASIQSTLAHTPAALETFNRLQEHLAANEIKLDANQLTLGMSLRVDPSNLQVLDTPAARELMTGTYREPFVVKAV